MKIQSICDGITELRAVRELLLKTAGIEYKGFYRNTNGTWTVDFTYDVFPAVDVEPLPMKTVYDARVLCGVLDYSLEESDGRYITIDANRGQRHGYAMSQPGIALMISDLEADIKEDNGNEEASLDWIDEINAIR